MKRIIFIVLAAMSLGVSGQSTTKVDMEVARSMEIMFDVYRDVNLFYVDSVKAEKLLSDALDGMLSELDPYCEYISAAERGDFDFATTGKYGGIGALIRQREDWVEIAEPYIGTPSAGAGLRAGDRLLEIDGVSLQKLGSAKVSSMLKGDPGTKFSLTIRPIADTNSTVTHQIIRQKIAVPGVPYFGIVKDSVGYIRLGSFTQGSAVEVGSALEALMGQGARSLVLDLRGNTGGIVGEAIDIVGLFVPRNTQTLAIRGRRGDMNATYSTSAAPLALNLPLAVLINSSSASASEIVAGALQDLDRAVVIGQRSFGKGLVQSTRPVRYKGTLKLTTAKYYTPSGRCIQALDYSHRRKDGSVGHIPDSIIKQYNTVSGRKVYDGGGVMPDIKLDAQYISQFGAVLTAFGFIDDFANIYVTKNPRPKGEFEVSDKLYSQFVEFMQGKEIKYESQSVRLLKALKESIKNERYDSRVKVEIEALEAKLKDDKIAQLAQFKTEISDLLAASLITRWSFNASAIENSLRGDSEIAAAIAVVSDSQRYSKILTTQDTSKN